MGLGLMGGSLGLALKAKSPQCVVHGYARRAETRQAALSAHVVDEVFERPEDAVRGAELVVICTPILSMAGLMESCRIALPRGCIITDVGSTKVEVAEQMRTLLQETGATYVGSHPIAGSEQQGLDAARPDLYEGAVVIVTSGPGSLDAAVDKVRKFWQSLGSVVRVMPAEQHDQVMARTSHLPHLVAVLLADTAGREGDLAALGSFCGPGFRDATRIAEGSPEVWHDIIRSNRKSVVEELRAYKADLDALLDMVLRGDFARVQRVLEQGRARRKAMISKKDIEEQRGST